MSVSLPSSAARWEPPGARFVLRVGRRAFVESLYLLTAPLIAAAGLLVVTGGLFAGTVGLLLPGRSGVPFGVLAPARWFADLERWRIARVRSLADGAGAASTGIAGRGPRVTGTAAASDPGLWLDAAHVVVVAPVALVTSVLTGLWWFTGVATVTAWLRYQAASPAQLSHLRPMTLYAGNAKSHIALSLGLTTPDERVAFGTTLGLLLLFTLPLVTRASTAAHIRIGQALLSDASALHRRISGLEQERDTARAQTVAAVTAEATALRRLERDIHDGPQQRLVRLAMELGRAQHLFDSRPEALRPEAVRETLAEAIAQTQEALEELRALSRGIAPPILTDRGLYEAICALAARSTIPVDFDAVPLAGRLNAAVETAAYFAVAEALTNVAKHSHARRCSVGLRHGDATLLAWVTDDGVGGAALDKGHGLRGLDDRLHAVGGRLRVASPPGGPTTIAAELPC